MRALRTFAGVVKLKMNFYVLIVDRSVHIVFRFNLHPRVSRGVKLYIGVTCGLFGGPGTLESKHIKHVVAVTGARDIELNPPSSRGRSQRTLSNNRRMHDHTKASYDDQGLR